jgi:hypothetical protein
MTAEELSGELLGIIYVLAEEIYFQKCMYFNVPRLSESDKKECVDEAVRALPEFLEAYSKYSDALKNMGVETSECKCVHGCPDWSENGTKGKN